MTRFRVVFLVVLSNIALATNQVEWFACVGDNTTTSKLLQRSCAAEDLPRALNIIDTTYYLTAAAYGLIVVALALHWLLPELTFATAATLLCATIAETSAVAVFDGQFDLPGPFLACLVAAGTGAAVATLIHQSGHFQHEGL